MDKAALKEMCLNQLQQKIKEFSLSIDELSDGVAGKSSAGDKHETERAMAQLQQEQYTHQINQLLEMQQAVQKLGVHRNEVIQAGSLVYTDKGILYIAAALGKIEFHQQWIMVISVQSPLAQQLMGKKKGGVVIINQLSYSVLDVV
jgi:hypothetical protein